MGGWGVAGAQSIKGSCKIASPYLYWFSSSRIYFPPWNFKKYFSPLHRGAASVHRLPCANCLSPLCLSFLTWK